MRFPAFLYGPWGDVRKQCLRKARAFLDGARLQELADSWLDTSTTPGIIALENAQRAKGASEVFHAYGFVRALSATAPPMAPPAYFSDFFEQSLHGAWSVTSLFGNDAAFLFTRDPMRYRPFVERVVQSWPTLNGIGARYLLIGQRADYLWSWPSLLKTGLHSLGVPASALQAELPLGGPGELLMLGQRIN